MISTDSLAKVVLSYGEMSHKKLQKLSYYVYAWYLVVNNNRLSDTRFEAWKHGPVSPQIYDNYKVYGWEEIPSYNDFLLVDIDTIAFAYKVMNYYYKYTADELEEMTHNEFPWINARQSLSEYHSSNNPILDTDIVRCHSEQKEVYNIIKM